MKVSYLHSAADADSWPTASLPEIALAGRSNAGKSTFVNCLAGASVARVSQRPGKTRVLNFYAAGENYFLVDLPGYGFAARSGKEMESWAPWIENYLASRTSLVGVLLLMDCRRKWTADEAQLRQFLEENGRRLAVVLTKADQLKKSERESCLGEMTRQSQVRDVFLISDREPEGVAKVEEFVFRNWVKDK